MLGHDNSPPYIVVRYQQASGPWTLVGRQWRPGGSPGRQPADCNFTIRGDKSFAHNLTDWLGPVSGRVALLLQSTEGNPDAG